MFKIGEFARLNKITVKTLRYYDEINILHPEKIDDFTGYRYYSAKQIPRLNRIISLKYMGFSLEEINYVLEKNMKSKEIEKILELKYLELKEKIEDEKERLNRIKNFIRICKMEDYDMKYDIILKEIEPVKVASLRDIIPTYSEQGHLWEELGAHIEKHGVKILPPCMVIYHDCGYKEESVDAEIVEPIEGNLPETDRIKVRVMDKIEKMACIVHKGPYETLHMAYNEISKWIEDNQFRIIGSQRELYLEGEWNTESPNDYITEIQFPVEKI